MTVKSFSAELRQRHDALWMAQVGHPFVQGIGTGTLSEERFTHWLVQDYLYLIDYSRAFAFAVAKAPDLETMRAFSRLLAETLETEMDLHRSYVAEFGVDLATLEQARKTATTHGYTNFLLRTAATGDFVELVAALLPCMWGYSDAGQRLATLPAPSDDRYARWIAMYAAPEFAGLAGWCRDLLDRAVEGAGTDARARADAAFVTSLQYEIAFWEMSWRLEPSLG